jgi:hypothetical protein
MLGTIDNRATACSESLSKIVVSTLWHAGVAMYDMCSSVGTIGGIDVSAASGNPARWVVSISLPLPCGSDGSVYVFEESVTGPTLVMAVEKNGYATVGEARGGGPALLSPPDARGRYFLVATEWVPRCGPGIFRHLIVRALAPAASPEKANPLLEWEKTVRDDGLDIRTSRDGFTVTVLDSDSIDFPRSRNLIRAYQRVAGHFVRVQPFAAEARDYPVEWASLPWPEASQLCVNGRRSELESWHRRFEETFKAKDEDAISFEEIRNTHARRTVATFACKTESKDRPSCKSLPREIDFRLVKDGEGWLIESIGDAAPNQRPGP